GCSRHMTGNISYLSDFEPFDEGYVSFGQGGCKITGKGTIKTGKLEFEKIQNVLCWEETLKYLFGPTSVSSISHKWYCLAVIDDFSRFTWTFFLRTKDETSDTLKKFITKIEDLKDLKVKIIRCDNGREFRNKEMNDFCSQKGIKREFSNARTPQQNDVAERRNRTLIEAARIMLADAKLPVIFWAKAVNTACYVQNRVLVNKSHNKTPYELFNDRTPAIRFLKPFGSHVMILNTLDNLGKFKVKGDEGYFIGYSMSSKAFRVFNKITRRVEESLHVEFLENKAIDKGAGPKWLFDIDSLTKSMNYMPVDAGTNSTNFLGTKDAANQEVKKDVFSLRYILLPNWAHDTLLKSSSSKPHDESSTKVPEGSGNPNPTASSSNPSAYQMKTLTAESPIPTVSSLVPTACLNDSPEPASDARLISKRVTNQEESLLLDKEALPPDLPDFLKELNVWTLVDCPKGVRPIGTKWVLKNKKDERGIVVRNKARLVAQGHTQEEGIDYDEVFAPIARIEAIRLFLAYASFMGFTVYQMDVKSAFLYDTIDEEDIPNWDFGELVAYSDSDYGGAFQDRKSTTSGSQFLGRRLFSLQCKKQMIIATSTTEAEYVVAASCCGQVLWIQN
nr:retrovirus-related Pol polyprotein from transposon TNT 1-94 [Tanacetum cinerariifolium]